jgi:transposase
LQSVDNQSKTAQIAQTTFDVVKDCTKEASEKLIKSNLTQKQLSNIRAVSMDMWESYIAVIENIIPRADIVHDKFHIIKYLKDAVDKERKHEVKSELVLKNSKYTLLKK